MNEQRNDITQALIDAGNGNESAASRLWDMVYDELRRVAHRELLGERAGHTLSTTALVHEAYLKLVDQNQISWNNRQHFLAVCSKIMRHILVDYARHRGRQKRQGSHKVVPLDDATIMADTRSEELIALDDALQHLSAMDERLSKVVELRFFGGLTTRETANVLGISTRTVERDWQRARVHLYQMIHPEQDPGTLSQIP